jgi:hypothetical protein
MGTYEIRNKFRKSINRAYMPNFGTYFTSWYDTENLQCGTTNKVCHEKVRFALFLDIKM